MIPSFRYRLFIPSYDVSITSRQRPISLWQPYLPDLIQFFRSFCILCQFFLSVNPFASPVTASGSVFPHLALSTHAVPGISTIRVLFFTAPEAVSFGTLFLISSVKLPFCRFLSNFPVFSVIFALLTCRTSSLTEDSTGLCFMWIIRLPINSLSTEYGTNLFF